MSLTREDCVCPVCLEIFVEPVTLPCSHTYCKECFLQAVDKASLCCPLCRIRISSWTRLHNRTQTLVNHKLWTEIQNVFPQQCERRLRGQDGDGDANQALPVVFPRVSQPGEVRREYEDQILKLRGLEAESERASEELIRKLQQEEKELQEAELQRKQEDERLARLLSNQLNSPLPSVDDRRHGNTPSRKRTDFGPMDRFLSPCPAHSSISSNRSPGSPSDGTKRRRTQEEPSNQSSECKLWEELEQDVARRRQQEVEDRAVAERLQQQLNQEHRDTDRRKGSADQYQLRGGCKSSVSQSQHRL